jgi:hypothetical protein
MTVKFQLLLSLLVPLRQSFHISSSLRRFKAKAHRTSFTSTGITTSTCIHNTFDSTGISPSPRIVIPSWRNMNMDEETGGQEENKTALVDAETSTNTRTGTDTHTCYTVCTHCQGQGKRLLAPTKKARLRHKRAKNDNDNNNNNNNETASNPVPRRLQACHVCKGSGVLESDKEPAVDTSLRLPELAIIGGGIGGLALATACRHRGIPHTVYERDQHFAQRSQGYG